jgi:hypothetical protein
MVIEAVDVDVGDLKIIVGVMVGDETGVSVILLSSVGVLLGVWVVVDEITGWEVDVGKPPADRLSSIGRYAWGVEASPDRMP